LPITQTESSPSNVRRTSPTAATSAQKIIIVPLHTFSGCGTTSGFYGYRKKTVYDKISKSQEACSLLQQIGKQLPVTNEVTDHLAHLNIRYLYNEKLSKSVGEARALKWGQMKRNLQAEFHQTWTALSSTWLE